MKKKIWLGTLALAATLCCSVGMANVGYTANAEETTVETPVAETTLQLLGGSETTAYNGSSKPTKWTYDASTRSGSISHTGGDKKYWFEGVQRADKVVMADGSVEDYDAQTLRYTVTFSNQACLNDTKANHGLGIVLIDDDIATNYWLLRNITAPQSAKYFSQGKKGTFAGSGNWCGQNEAFKLSDTSSFTMTVEVACGQQLRVWYNGTEVVDSGLCTYNGTTLPKVGMHTYYWSADYTVSAELVGVKSLYVEEEPETTLQLLGGSETTAYNGSSKPTTWTYDASTRSGSISHTGGDKKYWFEGVQRADKVVMEDGSLEDYDAQTLRYTVTFSNQACLDSTQKWNGLGIVLVDGDIATNYWLFRNTIDANWSKYFSQGKKGTFAGSGSWCGQNEAFKLGDASFTMTVEVACGQQLRVWYNGTEVVDSGLCTYNGTTLPKVGMHTFYWSADYTVSAELVGVKALHEHTEETLSAVAPTCTETGLTEGKKCSVCGMTTVAQETVPATHTTTKTEAVAPTCTEAGNIAYWTCSGVCGKTYSDEACTAEVTDTVVPAAGHNTTKTDAQAATCTEDGCIDFWFCTSCSKIYSDEAYTTEITAEQAVIAATGHTEETLAAVAPTCTETGLTEGKKCTVCNTVTVAQEEVAAAGHTEETLAAVAPTCTETGLTEGKKCTVCNAITVAQEEVAAAGHTEETLAAVAPTCTETGLTEGKKCSVCEETLLAQEEVAAAGHTESDWIVDTEAQVGVVGSQHKECTVCGETLATEEIPALEAPETSSEDKTSEDKTDSASKEQPDSTVAGCFGTIGGLSAGIALMGVAAVAFLRKKED